MLIADWTIERKGSKSNNNLNEKPRKITPRRIIHDASFFFLFLIGTYLSGAPPQTINYDFHPVPRVGYEWLYKITPPFNMFRFLEGVRWWWYWVGNLTVLGISQVSWLQAIFNSKFCQWLGKLSFALYLVHALVISALSGPLEGVFTSLGVENAALLCFLQFVVQAPLIAMLSAVVERCIDRPSIRFARWIEGLAFRPKSSVELGVRREARHGQEMVALIPPV
jgi:peptidoglycan/LPS O-acetylase OafA/YrhL